MDCQCHRCDQTFTDWNTYQKHQQSKAHKDKAMDTHKYCEVCQRNEEDDHEDDIFHNKLCLMLSLPHVHDCFMNNNRHYEDGKPLKYECDLCKYATDNKLKMDNHYEGIPHQELTRLYNEFVNKYGIEFILGTHQQNTHLWFVEKNGLKTDFTEIFTFKKYYPNHIKQKILQRGYTTINGSNKSQQQELHVNTPEMMKNFKQKMIEMERDKLEDIDRSDT